MAKIWCLVGGLILCGAGAELRADEARQAVRNQSAETSSTMKSSRAEGPAGLDRMLMQYDQLVRERDNLAAGGRSESRQGDDRGAASLAEIELHRAKLEAQIESLRDAIDQVGGQRGCSVSRLYWYTDLDEAKAAAASSGKPILSLRMLGKLTDEYSCANSRFFRTALYSNKEVSDFLRANFVLHWQSVRPVPRVTIDFGDGRKLERTLTGNSAHYVLASDGTPLDVLPGLYSPQAFKQWLTEMQRFYAQYDSTPAATREALLQAFHRAQEQKVLRSWDRDINRLGRERIELVSSRIDQAMKSDRAAEQSPVIAPNAPQAMAAARRAVVKTQAESPMVLFANLGGKWMERGMDDDLWQAVADLHRGEVKLDNTSVAVMNREFPRAALAGKIAATKSRPENPILRVVRSFENSMSLDTVRNEYLLHRRVHEEFVSGASMQTKDFDSLNEWVYAELFLTPSHDPWLGLAPNDVYTALDDDGRTEVAVPQLGAGG